MKTKQYLAMMFAATALFACNNDDAPKPEEMGEAGKAWASFSISIPKTKAADANATTAEATINTVTIYQKGAGTQGAAKEVAHFSNMATDFGAVSGADVNTYVATKAVEVNGIAGQTCEIFAVINKTAAIEERHIFDASTANSVLTITGVEDLKATATGFVMSSKAAVEATMHADAAAALAATHATIVVERAVSKVLVEASAALDLTKDVPDGNTNGSTGEFAAGSIKWLIGNSNKKFNVIPNTDIDATLGFGKDPNFPALTGTPTYGSLNDEYVQLVLPTYDMVVAANNTPATTDASIQYCVENNNETYQIGNTSYVSVIAEFAPNLIVVLADVADVTNEITPPTTPGTVETFYYHPDKQLYFNAEAYVKYTTTNTAAITDFWGPYSQGRCYYHVPIGKGIGNLQTAELGVIRNHLYTLTINSLKAPGNPLATTTKPTDPGTIDPDPTDPIIPSTAWISADLKVEAWQGILMGTVDLE